ncbi:hypothetical protein [Staphylococcus sp. HMSC34B12]|uniref:hypothetical protein n=1 Tax=Staphylococcus sp. HMSC34B12 TaxID=1608857 RepID=UPI00091F5782|nr:hypothetical protein [Staphylococcus sp. HMSC34B12]OHR79249.1 hypothetical protein HMPREF3238_02270 [Staphylococcus sp. HMSC34B12]
MTKINSNFPDLESSSKLKGVGRFETFDINNFTKGKTFAIEKVTVDEHIKFDVRIMKDETEYNEEKDKGANENKIITLIIHEDIADQVNLINIIGRGIEFDGVTNDDARVYGVNSLQVVVKNLNIKENKIEGFEPLSSITKADRRLSKMNEFKTFDYEKFLRVHDMEILTIYPQTPTTARLIGIITSDDIEDEKKSNVGKTFAIKIDLPTVRDIPLELLIGNKQFTRENLLGNLYGMVVKNNQVLLIADSFQLEHEGNKLIIGNVNKDVNNDVSNNVNKDVNNNVNNNISKEVNNNVNNDVNNNVNNNYNKKFDKKNKFHH